MKKTKESKKYIFIAIGISFVIILFILEFILPFHNASMIIGGADGPTAIYLARSNESSMFRNILILTIAVLVLYKPIKKILNK